MNPTHPSTTTPRKRRRAVAVSLALGATLVVIPNTAQATPTTPTPLAASASTSVLLGLQYGDRGAAVKKLQRMLQKTGLVVSGGADGVFGPGTQSALKMFQSWNGLQPTGTVTEATLQWLRIAVTGASGGGGSGGSGGTSNGSGGGGSGAHGVTGGGSKATKWRGLKYGDRGTAVKRLQKALIRAGVPVVGGADGIFGSGTQSAVSSFQGWNGLGATGVVNRATAKAIRAAAKAAGGSSSGGSGGSSKPNGPGKPATRYVGLRQGDSGSDVKDLQRALMETGLSLLGGADGVFGPATTSTLKVFQRMNGLKQTGIVGRKAARYLGLGSSSSGGVGSTVGYAQYGEVGPRVVTLQKALMSAGIYVPGGADGVFGGGTAGAVMEFQRREGLAVTGKIDSVTASRLNLRAAPAPAPPSSSSIRMKEFPVQGLCWFGDTWLAPRGDGRTHQGTDVIADEGKRLFAVVDGVVTVVYKNYPGSRAGNGLRVAQPNGTYFTYLHLRRFAKGVGVGTPVRAGDVVGYVGNTGNSATPHLHFEIHPYGGAAINPYPLLKEIDDCYNTSPTR